MILQVQDYGRQRNTFDLKFLFFFQLPGTGYDSEPGIYAVPEPVPSTVDPPKRRIYRGWCGITNEGHYVLSQFNFTLMLYFLFITFL